MCQEYKGVPCNCDVTCVPVEEKAKVGDAKEMKMTGDIIIRALSAVSTAVNHSMISEEEYLKKYSDFVNKKDEEPDDKDNTKKDDKDDDDEDDGWFIICKCAFTGIVFVVGMIILFSVEKPKYN